MTSGTNFSCRQMMLTNEDRIEGRKHRRKEFHKQSAKCAARH